jgi:hypothetical protein
LTSSSHIPPRPARLKPTGQVRPGQRQIIARSWIRKMTARSSSGTHKGVVLRLRPSHRIYPGPLNARCRDKIETLLVKLGALGVTANHAA